MPTNPSSAIALRRATPTAGPRRARSAAWVGAFALAAWCQVAAAAPNPAGHAGSTDPFAPAALEGPSVPPNARLDGPRSGFAARHERVEVRVDGPPGAPLVLLASAVGADEPAPAVDAHAFVVLADGRHDPAARFDGAGAWQGRFPVPDGFAVGERLVLEAHAVEASGARRLGGALVLEVVDLWSFDAARLAGNGSGWADVAAAGPLGPWRGRAFGARGAASGWIDVRVELSAVNESGTPPEAFVVVAPTPWPASGEPAALAAWLAGAVQRGGWARLGDVAQANPSRGEVRWTAAGEGRLVVQADTSGRWWLAVGTAAGTRRLVLDRVRVLLRAAR